MGPERVGELNGLGVRFEFDKKLHKTYVYEGQFKCNKLNGFGRLMTCFFSGEKSVITESVGYFKDNVKHGWLMTVENNGH